MKNPNIKVEVIHSEKNTAWNIVGKKLGGKWKIARCPYLITGEVNVDNKFRVEALEHAKFIAWCFNNSERIIANYGK